MESLQALFHRMNPHERQERERLELLLGLAPQIADGKTCLYIGASKSRFQLGTWLHEMGYEITLVEAYPENAMHYTKDKRVAKVVCANIITTADHSSDLVVWWHGPEHVTKREMYAVLPKLEFGARIGVVLATPYGEYIQGKMDGSPWERHLWHPMPEDFEGYEVGTIGKPGDGPQSCIVAWKETA